MVKSDAEMAQGFNDFTGFIDSLCELGDKYWDTPIAEGKWTVKDIVCHMMLWDKYFYEEAINKIKLNEPLTLKHLDFNNFNANAVLYAKSRTKQEICTEFVEYRSKIISAISGLPDEEYLRTYVDGDGEKFSIRSYLQDFIPHDKHHQKQVEKFIKYIA
jgi:uncharacterized damage-inducible protein DinB